MNSGPGFSQTAHLLSLLVYGLKGMRYLISPNYRVRVQHYWGNNPGSSSRDIPRMVIGVMIYAGIVGFIAAILSLR
jgi:hypothetical protein